jgi:hypothetical protein
MTPKASDQAYVNDAVDFLAGAAGFTLHKMAFIIFAHLRRQAGNVVTPARQNLAHNGIDALLTHRKDHAIE